MDDDLSNAARAGAVGGLAAQLDLVEREDWSAAVPSAGAVRLRADRRARTRALTAVGSCVTVVGSLLVAAVVVQDPHPSGLPDPASRFEGRACPGPLLTSPDGPRDRVPASDELARRALQAVDLGAGWTRDPWLRGPENDLRQALPVTAEAVSWAMTAHDRRGAAPQWQVQSLIARFATGQGQIAYDELASRLLCGQAWTVTPLVGDGQRSMQDMPATPQQAEVSWADGDAEILVVRQSDQPTAHRQEPWVVAVRAGDLLAKVTLIASEPTSVMGAGLPRTADLRRLADATLVRLRADASIAEAVGPTGRVNLPSDTGRQAPADSRLLPAEALGDRWATQGPSGVSFGGALDDFRGAGTCMNAPEVPILASRTVRFARTGDERSGTTFEMVAELPAGGGTRYIAQVRAGIASGCSGVTLAATTAHPAADAVLLLETKQPAGLDAVVVQVADRIAIFSVPNRLDGNTVHWRRRLASTVAGLLT